MICTECKVRNPVGNKFCRECGTKLAAPTDGSLAAEEAARVAQERAQEKAAVLLASAQDLSEKNLHEEAIPLASQAAALLPESTSAHSLLAALYERTGQNAQAIAQMERVVTLNPGSAADAEKLDQLRRGVHILPRRLPGAERLSNGEPTPREPKSSAYIPFALAGGVTVGVLVLGLALLNRPQQASTAPRPTPLAPPSSPGIISPSDSVGIIRAVPTAGTNAIALKPQAGWVAPPPPSNARPDPFASLSGSAPLAKPIAGSARLPRPAISASERPLGIAPVTLPGIGATISPSGGASIPPILAAPPRQSAPGFGAGGRIPAGPPPSSGSQPSPGNTSSGGSDGGYIRITVGPPGGGTSGSGSGANSGGSPLPAPTPRTENTTNPMTLARRLQREGQYREAINAYREGINSGAGGDAYQGIAQCYKALGDEGAARGSYRDALRVYEAQAASGRGGGAAQRGITACKAALDLLGG